jgi:endonuclease YncB( thermonuclease family)
MEHLETLAKGKQVTCYLDGTRAGRSNRPVAVCKVEGRDLGELQVLAGMALDCAAYSRGRYAKAEQTAFENGKNLRAEYSTPEFCE